MNDGRDGERSDSPETNAENTESREATQAEVKGAFDEPDVETDAGTELTGEEDTGTELAGEKNGETDAGETPDAPTESREATEDEVRGAFDEPDIGKSPEPEKIAGDKTAEQEKTDTALSKSPTERSWRDTERADAARNPGFEAQKSFQTDPKTGEVLRDKDGKMIECPPNTKGAVRPDLIRETKDGVEIREDKNYANVDNLMQNIKHQSEQRKANFGEDVKQTYVVAPKMSVGDAERLQDYVENKLGHNLEIQHK